MTGRILIPEPLSAERFAPFGDVISSGSARGDSMNEARFDRFSDLAAVDVDGRVSVSIVRSRSPTSLPYHFDRVERHPLGSQAFIPLSNFAFIVVVAPPAESVEPADLLAFITDGRQGIDNCPGGGGQFIESSQKPGVRGNQTQSRDELGCPIETEKGAAQNGK